jgi:hypothetical protein
MLEVRKQARQAIETVADDPLDCSGRPNVPGLERQLQRAGERVLP